MSELRTITPGELATILESHAKWLRDKSGGERADLERADLRSADLRYANLRWADLESADLRYANLERANLERANLRWANLRYANLRYANLRWADLRWADLESADLESADLRYAKLERANLERANLRWANLRYANLELADLRSANLCSTACCHALLGSYDVWTSPTHTRIGCQLHSNEQWIRLTFDRAESMAAGAREWWSLYRDVVLSMIRTSERQGWPARDDKEVQPCS